MMGRQAPGWLFVTERIYGASPVSAIFHAGPARPEITSLPAASIVIGPCQPKLITAIGWGLTTANRRRPVNPAPTCGNDVRTSSFISESSFPDPLGRS
jgi:hypothetical protein